LRGEAKPNDWREVTYYRYWMHLAHNLRVPAHFGIRSDRYKLIFFYGVDIQTNRVNPRPPNASTPPAWEFYDLEKDPNETTNLYSHPDYQKIIAEMKEQLKATRAELGETDKSFPEIQAVIDSHWGD